jgi:pyruvate formate lyase activating enzyme
MDTLADEASPEAIAQTARQLGCRSVAYTYNDPVIFHEYAIDVAKACAEYDIKSVAVTAGYVCTEPRAEFYQYMDAANVDLKSFNEAFYHKLTGGHLEPVLDTLKYLIQETGVWIEITTLLIPGENDSDQELNDMSQWVVDNLGPDVPLHFTAFHPDWKMRDYPPTPHATLSRARRIARDNGVHHAYVGNVHDSRESSTWCYHCGKLLIQRDWYELGQWHLDADGCCDHCGSPVAGIFDPAPGEWGSRRQAVRMSW